MKELREEDCWKADAKKKAVDALERKSFLLYEFSLDASVTSEEGGWMIVAIILAAGESRRMGNPKMLLPYGKKTMIETVIDNVVKSKVDHVLVVLGSDRRKIERKIKNYSDIEIVYNPDYSKGMLSSVQKGFQSMPGNAKGIIVLLGDQPSVSTAVINSLIDACKKKKKGIVLPTYEGDRGHPVLINIKYRTEVEKLSPDTGLRGLVYSHPEDILEVAVEDRGILQDIDDMEDYRRELKKKEKGS